MQVRARVPEEIYNLLPAEGIFSGCKPMKDLKEAVAKIAIMDVKGEGWKMLLYPVNQE